MDISKAKRIIVAVQSATSLLFANDQDSLEYILSVKGDLNFGTKDGSVMEGYHSTKDLRDAEVMKIFLKTVFEVDSIVEAHEEWVFLMIKTR